MNQKSKELLQHVAVNRIRHLRRNPQFQTESQMDALKRSIERDGFLAPILLRPIEDNKFEVLSGNHRLIACRELGRDTVPAIVVEMTDSQAARVAVNLNTIHGDPQAEQLVPFLADLDDDTLRDVHLERDLLEDVKRFDEELRARLDDLRLPDIVDNKSVTNSLEKCACDKCGRIHFKK